MLNELIQRRLKEGRAEKIAKYLLREEQRFFNALVVGVYGGDPRWYDIDDITPQGEGIDIPEVGFIGILDADKEGFLRDQRSLIQIIGRAARNVNAKVVLYADTITNSMQKALDETM